MLIKPYGKKTGSDLWFRIPRVGNVDISDKYFGIKGEFSPESDIAFNKHCNRLDKLAHSPFFYRYNGQRLKEIRRVENLWY